MTKHERLLDNYEDALFALLMEKAMEEEGAELLEENERLKNDPDTDLSTGLDRRCIRTIDRALRKEKTGSAGSTKAPRVRSVWKPLLAAAALVVLLLGSMIAVQATGVSVFGFIGEWTSDTFGFVPSEEPLPELDESENQAIPEQLKELRDLMIEHDVPIELLPTYIPRGGYRRVSTSYNEVPGLVSFSCILKKNVQWDTNENTIVILYRVFYSGKPVGVYDKDNGAPKLYVRNGVPYYIMTRDEKYLAVWISDNIECSISGVESYEEMICIIDSIASNNV